MPELITIVTIENPGRAVDEHRCSNGAVASIGDNQCRDFPKEIADELLKEYTWLKVISVTGSSMPSVSVPVEEKELPKDDVIIDPTVQDQKYVCSVCAETFKNNAGMRAHMKFKHET